MHTHACMHAYYQGQNNYTHHGIGFPINYEITLHHMDLKIINYEITLHHMDTTPHGRALLLGCTFRVALWCRGLISKSSGGQFLATRLRALHF